MPDILHKSIQYVKGVGAARAEDFARLGITTVRDLLFTFPRDISDRSNISMIGDIRDDVDVVVVGNVIKFSERKMRRGRLHSIIRAIVDDGTGHIEACWFNSPWVADKLKDATVLLYGKVKRDRGVIKMDHPVFEVVPDDGELGTQSNAGRIVPIYPCTGKLTQNIWRKVMTGALEEACGAIEELYPPEYLRDHNLLGRSESVYNMHFPESEQMRQQAWQRLAYDECLMMQLIIALRRRDFYDEFPGRRFVFSHAIDSRIRRLLPFRLTGAQERVIAEIIADMQEERPMHRLLQGDVGSGKTAVAFFAILLAVANKAQVCFMAPTSLLAQQHFNTISGFLANSERSKVSIRLMTSGMSRKEREILKAELVSGGIDVLIATHAAIEDDVQFSDLGLVIIDEQHKFGVNQRGALVSKGVRPDTLVMTATPIPRSLAMTVYGDLEVSVIDQLPPGRKPVKTSLLPLNSEDKVWGFIKQEFVRGGQAYVVCPLLEENEELSLTSAKEAYERMSGDVFSGYKVGLMHGKMNKQEQQEVMRDFREHKIDLLVSTVVVEVGVDVPNSNVMVIMHAERFGLAQLHQLRGRVGRGGEQGYFIMLSGGVSDISRERLEVLVSTNDGFEIAEADLRLRGPGEFLGTRQHGLPELKLVDIVDDFAMIKQAKAEAQELLPELATPRFSKLRAELIEFNRKLDNNIIG